MKLTKLKLQRIIQEEIKILVREDTQHFKNESNGVGLARTSKRPVKRQTTAELGQKLFEKLMQDIGSEIEGNNLGFDPQIFEEEYEAFKMDGGWVPFHKSLSAFLKIYNNHYDSALGDV